VAAQIGDLRWHAHDGFHWMLPYSKTDQAGEGHTVVLPRGTHTLTCVACALTRWLQLRAVLAAAAAAPPGHEYREAASAPSTRSRAIGRRQRVAAMRFLLQTRQAPTDRHVCRRPPGWRSPAAPPLVVPLASMSWALRATDAVFVSVHR